MAMDVIRTRTLSPMGRGQGEVVAAPPDLARIARRLRRDQTQVERLLWSRLRGRRLSGWKSKRQMPIHRYIVDFCCPDAWLVVELDGGGHSFDDVAARDVSKTTQLESRGYLVLRFWNREVTDNLDRVCETILNAVAGRG